MANSEQQTYKIDWRIINWMRGLAALYVVMNHSRGHLFSDAIEYAKTVTPKAQWGAWEWLNILLMEHTDLGTEFVILFFVLSGFSIAHSISNNSTGTLGFYKRRLVRLYPPYLLGILWAIIVFLLIKYFAAPVFYTSFEGQPPISDAYHKFKSIPALISNLLYVPKDNYLTPQYWSLPFEVLFYLLAPWAIKKLKWYGAFTIALYLIGWGIKGYIYFDDDKDPIIPQFLTDYNIYFLLGVLFYTYRQYLITNYRLNKTLSIFSILILFELLVISKSYIFHQQSNKLTGLAMVLFSFITLFAGMKYNIRYRWLERIGIFSYTLYISHFASIFLLKIIFYNLGLNFYHYNLLYPWYIGIVVPVVSASILYYMAEYPAIKYLERLRISAASNS